MDESQLQLVSEIGSQLGRLARPNKDLLVKSLRQAASALAQIEQPLSPEASERQENGRKIDAALKPLRKSFIKHRLVRYADKDVKLLVAICISEIFRLMAPEPPFEDKYLREIFKLILSMFLELADTTSPYFSRRVKILETVARCKCCVIMLDIDCSDLVLEMFNIFFSVVREYHQHGLVNDALSIMANILSEEASQPLLDVILRNLVKEGKAASTAASQLAISVIQTCAEKLEPFVCGFLTSCFLDRDAVESELKEFYHEILYKIFQCAPQMLLAVIPNLTQELQTDQVDVRIKAVNLIAKLLALPEHNVAQKYRNLFSEFKNRFSDKSVEVRLTALQCAKVCFMTNPSSKESCEVLSAIEGRLLDIDDRVRTQAVVVICDLARSKMKNFPHELITKATERLRDKKISVRKKALQKLMELYRDYCDKCSDGHMTANDHFEQIPCKVLLLCYDKDCKEFRSQNMELILAEDLFSVILSVEERTKHWIHIFSLCETPHVKALNSILFQKRRLQSEMKNYLSVRKKEKVNNSEEMMNKIQSSFMKMSTSFPDPSEAEDCLHKLNQMKDNSIFNALEQLLDQQTMTNAQKSRDKFLKIIGDKHPYFDFFQLLSSKCSFNIFGSDNVRCILHHLCSNVLLNGYMATSAAKLLLAIISIFPSLVKGSEGELLMLLEENNPVNSIMFEPLAEAGPHIAVKIRDVLIEALAKAGPHISVTLSDIYPILERVCLEGTRIQSKHAVSAIASLGGTSEQFILSKLCKKLVDSLHSGWNTPTILQSLGCIAQYSVSAFETQEGEIRSYIFKRIFKAVQSDDPTLSADTSGCSDSGKLKIYGLKTLVKSVLPHRGSVVRLQIGELLDVLLKMLQTGDSVDGIISCANDKPHIRLAAAKAVLRLCRRWDLHISPQIFCLTILMAKDTSSFVRRAVLDKTHKLLKKHILPSKYACAFALAVSDCCKDLQDMSYKYMEEFIKDYTREARISEMSAVQEGSITDHPAYTVVYLLHILAHDPEYPPEDCQDEEVYARFCSPLFWLTKVLINACTVEGDVESVMHLITIFHAVRRAEDAVDSQKTPKLQFLAEFGISSLTALNQNSFSSLRTHGLVLLPSSLFRMSTVRSCDEANLKSLTQFSVNESFLIRIIQILKSQISVPASTLPKHGVKCQEDNRRFADIRQKRAVSSIASEPEGSHNDCSFEAFKSHSTKISNLILDKEPSYGNSATMKTAPLESQVSIQNVESVVPSLSENVRARSGITAGSSKNSRDKLRESCSSRGCNVESERFVGKQVKLLSPVDKCFHSGTMVDFISQDNTHENSCVSADVETLCLDSEDWETINDCFSEQKENMVAEDSNSFHSTNSNAMGCYSRSNQKKKINTSKAGATKLRKRLAKESGKFTTGMTSFPAKRQKGLKVFSDKLALEVTNVDAVARRTRRQKV